MSALGTKCFREKQKCFQVNLSEAQAHGSGNEHRDPPPPMSALHAKSPCFLISPFFNNGWAHTAGASLVPQSLKNPPAMQETACNAGDGGSIPGSGRSPGEGHGNPLQYSCLENPMDRGAWWATVHGVPRARQDLASKPPPHDPRIFPSSCLFSHFFGNCCLCTLSPVPPNSFIAMHSLHLFLLISRKVGNFWEN